MVQLKGWFWSWVPSSAFSTGGGRSSVEAWYTTALDIEEVLSGAVDSDIHLYVPDVMKSFDTVDRGIQDRVLSSLGVAAWFRMPNMSFTLMLGCGLNLRRALVSPWTRDGGIPQGCR